MFPSESIWSFPYLQFFCIFLSNVCMIIAINQVQFKMQIHPKYSNFKFNLASKDALVFITQSYFHPWSLRCSGVNDAISSIPNYETDIIILHNNPPPFIWCKKHTLASNIRKTKIEQQRLLTLFVLPWGQGTICHLVFVDRTDVNNKHRPAPVSLKPHQIGEWRTFVFVRSDVEKARGFSIWKA